MSEEQARPNPYVGPRTFTERDSRLFFGRDQEARDLLARVVSERLLLFYAQSGAGKSSLINARLVPGLREEGFAVLPVGRVSGAVPPDIASIGNIYLFNLMLSVDQGENPPATFANLDLPDFLARLTTENGTEWCYDAAATPIAAPGTQPYVLIIDQFEEIVTAHAARWPERQGFFAELDRAMRIDRNLWVVLTLREDYVAALDPFAAQMTDRLRARFYMERMGVAAALDAVRKPAARRERPFAPGVAEKLVDDLRQVRVPGQDATAPGEYVEPVQLQVVCYQLWERLAAAQADVEDKVEPISEADLASSGDVNQALTQFYEDTLASVLGQEAIRGAGVDERRLRQWFDRELVTETGIRGTVYRNEATGLTGTLPNAAVDALSRRFLVRLELRGGGTWVELVHDRFVVPITKSNEGWFARNLSSLTRAAQGWAESGRTASFLYQGQALRDALSELEREPDRYGNLEREFLHASEEQVTRRENRRRRLTITGLTALVVILLALSGWALWSNVRAVRSRREALDAQAGADRAYRTIRANQIASRTSAASDPTLALLLAIEAVRPEFEQDSLPSPRAEQALRRALGDEQTVVTLPGAGGATITQLAMSPDGEYLAAGDQNGSVWVHLLSEPAATVVSLPVGSAAVRALLFSADSDRLAAGDDDGTVVVWDVRGGQPIAHELVGHHERIAGLAFSPNGNLLASASWDQTVRVWTLGAESQAGPVLTGQRYYLSGVDFLDDTHVAASSGDRTVAIWDLASPQAAPRILKGHTDGVTALAVNRGARLFASSGLDASVRLWNLDQLDQELRVSRLHEAGVDALRFSPTGEWLATGSSDGTAGLLSITSGSPATLLRGHQRAVTALAFSGDAARLATGGADGRVLLWRVGDVRPEPVELRSEGAAIRGLAFSPGGKYLAVGDASGKLQLWKMSVDELVARGCETAGRNLTQQEWEANVPEKDYAITCPGLPPHDSAVNALLAQGDTLATRGDPAHAEEFYVQALELKPGLGFDPKQRAADKAAEAKQAQAPGNFGDKAKLWKPGTTIHIRFLSGTAAQQKSVADAASEWTKYANIKFAFDNAPDAPVRIDFQPNVGVWSFLGTAVFDVATDKPTMNIDVWAVSMPEQIQKQFGHLLGLPNEINNPNIDIPWDKEGIYRSLAVQGWTKATVDTQVFQQYPRTFFPVEKQFDPSSVMMVAIPNDWTVGDLQYPSPTGLSEYDKKFIGLLYPFK